MRILIVGEFWFGSTTIGLAQGLRAQGHVVTELDINDFFISGASLTWRVASRLLTGRSIRAFQTAILNQARRERVDIAIFNKGIFVEPATLDALRAMGIPSINVYPDVEFDHPGFSQNLVASYDLFVTTKSYHMPWLKSTFPDTKSAFLPHGYSELVHRPRQSSYDDAKDFDCDISYVGNPSSEKAAWVNGVLAAHPDRSIVIAGNDWDRYIDRAANQHCLIIPALIGDFYARAIERARINLAVHWGAKAGRKWHDLVSTRTYEIPACHGFMLHVDNEEVRDLFVPQREIDVFSTPDELNEKIDWYLDHPEERIAVAHAGFTRAVPAYGYNQRARDLMALLDAAQILPSAELTAEA